MAITENIKIEDAKIIFRNFEGRATAFNREGDKNFCVIIPDPDIANSLLADGWNIKTIPPREDGDSETFYIQVAVSWKAIPPRITLVTKTNKVHLDEESVKELDHAEILNVDLVIRPYNWELQSGKSGIKAYLKTMYVTIEEDEFADKYAD